MAGCQVMTELLRLEEVIGEKRTQINISGEAIIPDIKPEAVQIIDHVVDEEITKVEVIRHKVIVEGVLHLKIVYEGFVPEQTVHVFHSDITFSTFAEVHGAEEDMTVDTKIDVESISFDVNTPPSRRVQVRAILRLRVKVLRPTALKVVTDITGVPGIKITRQSFRAEDIIGRERTQVVTRADIVVPEQKPSVVQVIDSLVECDVTDVDIIKNKAIIRGTISSRIIYESDSPYQTVHVVHGETTFEHFVEIPGLDEDMTVTADCNVEFAQFDVANNGRMVVGRIVIMIKVRATTIRTLDLVVDVEGLPDGCALAKELVRIQEVLAERTRQSIVSAVLDIPEEKPDVVSVVKHEADIQIERVTVIKNKVLVEGIIHLKTVYEGLVPAQTVHVVHHDIRFADFVHLPGATEDMTAEVDVDVEHVSYDVGAGDPIAVQIVLKIRARIVVTRQVHIVVKVTVAEAVCIGVCIGEWVNVRPGPSTEGPPIARLARGEQVAVISMDGQWFRIRLHDGRHGFVFGQFLKCDCIPRG